ncbi:hypothetical protein J5T34_11725 [Cupriavidus gilardii]|uniref:hypothetical protein n=1 Tax=Cupriavidus gilardii TaxID=82541 RepID=UPI001ABECBB3|nr:hypothetical protein [Cupriavidus gilardii]MBO4121393.1 hypothetical protein [Cupriavidus gilardii]
MPFRIPVFGRSHPSNSVFAAPARPTASPAVGSHSAQDLKFIHDLLDGLRWADGNPVALRECLLRFAQSSVAFPERGDFEAAVAQALAAYSTHQRRLIAKALASDAEIRAVSQDLQNTPYHGDSELRLHAAARVDALRQAGMQLPSLLMTVAAKAAEPDMTPDATVSFDTIRYQELLHDFVQGIVADVEQQTLMSRFQRLLAAGGAKVAMTDAELNGYHASIELAMSRLDAASLTRVQDWFQTQPAVLSGRVPAIAKGATAARAARTPLLALCRRDEDYAARELAKLRVITEQVASRKSQGTLWQAQIRDLANRFAVFASVTKPAGNADGMPAVDRDKVGPLLTSLANAAKTIDQYGRAWSAVAPEACASRLQACHHTLNAIVGRASERCPASVLETAATLIGSVGATLTRLTDLAALKAQGPSTSSGSNARWDAEVEALVQEMESAAAQAAKQILSESIAGVMAVIPEAKIDTVPPLIHRLASDIDSDRERASAEVDRMIGHIENVAAVAGASALARHDLPMFNMRVALLLRTAGHLLNDEQLRRLSRCEGLGMPMAALCNFAKEHRNQLRLCLQAETAPELANALANATRAGMRLFSDTLFHGGTHNVEEARNMAFEQSGRMMAKSMQDIATGVGQRELGRVHARLQGNAFQALHQVLHSLDRTSPYDLADGTKLRLPPDRLPDIRLLAGMNEGTRVLRLDAARAAGKIPTTPRQLSDARWDEITSFLCGSGKVLDPSLFWELEEPYSRADEAQRAEPPDQRPSPKLDPARSQLLTRGMPAQDWEDSWTADDEVVITEEDNPNWVSPDATHEADLRRTAREALRDMVDAANQAVGDALAAITQWDSRAHRPNSNMLLEGRNRDIYVALQALYVALQRVDTSILRPDDMKVIDSVIRNDEWTVDGFEQVARILNTVSALNAQILDNAADQSILDEVKASAKALHDVLNLFDKKRPTGMNEKLGFRFRNAREFMTTLE